MRYTAILTLFSMAALAQDSSVNTIASAGYLYPAPATVAPGQVITLFVSGSAQGDVSATVRQSEDYAAPVLSVRPSATCVTAPQTACSTTTAVTIQIPFEIEPSCFSCAKPASFFTQVFVTQNGAAGAAFDLNPLTDRIHFLTTCDTAVPSGGGYGQLNGLPCSPYVTHADGSLVTSTSPAQGDEELVAYAVGLGVTTPAVATGQATPAAAPTQQIFLLSFDFTSNAQAAQPIQPALGVGALTKYARPLFSGLTAGYVGLYQVNFVVPPPPTGLPSCGAAVQSNVTVSMGGQYSFDGMGICLAP